MNRRTFVLSSCASLLAFHRVEAQTVNLSDEAIHDILRRRIDVEKRATGMVVGIVERGRLRVMAYGKQASGDARPVAANTLFEIGSLTKVFTALLLADMVHRKELQFDDAVDRYLPAGFRTPQRNARAITLADLATHTSGLPLFPPVTGNPLEALARYTASDLRSWLAGLTLSRDPGAQWEYSNVGYCLLGLALVNKARTTYDVLLNRRIIGPMRLKDTTLRRAKRPDDWLPDTIRSWRRFRRST
jgi:serine-type D-Ala-D-Ala carboxypeptidase/endopeptidase